jgi:23S rRNA (adenine-N6)-dimethyltransferase
VGAPARGPRPDRSRPSGQHFLRSRRVAEELVDLAAVGSRDLVVEIGAGTGRLTEPLARRALRVIAVDVDPDLAARLRRQFAETPRVEVLEGSFLDMVLPASTFRAFGNIPFALTSAILRRLLDDPGAASLARADLLVQYEVARKRASLWPSTLASLRWSPWWQFSLVRRLPRSAFEPPPAVDAAMLTITRRDPPLLPSEEQVRFARFLVVGFRRAPLPLRRSIGQFVSAKAWSRFARDRGVDRAAGPNDLDVFDWVELFRLAHPRSAP